MTVPPDRGVSRRSFLKGSAVAGIATTGITAAAHAAPTKPDTFGPGEHEITLLVNGKERKVKVEILTFAPGTFDKRGTCSFRFDVKGYAADTKLEASGVARQVPCYAIE